MNSNSNFLQDTWAYAKQIKEFKKEDWLVYLVWVGLMSGLVFCTAGFVLAGHFHGVVYPAYVWNLPIGTFVFVFAISFDTIGHRTTYKAILQKGEALVHHITIFAGITSCLLLCMAYHYPDFLRIPALSMIALSIFYSVIDEALHWHRYLNMHSDRIEMWSHFFIFLGHTIFIISWYHWFTEGYPGVKETVSVLQNMGVL